MIRWRLWCSEHSLSIALFATALVAIALSSFCFDTWREWARDTLNGLGVGSSTAGLIVWTKKYLVEHGTHPSPESK
jgi:hypothetical protein